MDEACFHLFDTNVGRCAIEWRGAKVTRVRLPAASDGRLRTAIICQAADARETAPPPFAAIIRDKIIALCRGERTDFHGAPLDRAGIDPLAARVYAALVDVPFGETTTYGAIAERLGDKALARAVGAALGANPFPIIIPCHRVTASGGRMGGFTAPGGIETKRRLLEIEGAFAAERLPLFAR
ncbi:MAG: methylated-DNA--[protein]-cysteine S-methyltransferase [Parvularculaceae bacterium]